MTRWPEDGEQIVDGYVAGLHLRYPITPIYYRQALHSFRTVAVRLGATNRQTVEEWLRERGQVWARSTVLQRVRIVDRFLDALAEEGTITSNPIADLQKEYNARSTIATIRALMAPNPDRALEAIRRPQPFESTLGDMMRDHIERMQRRGYRYETAAVICRRFDRFLQQTSHPDGESPDELLRSYRASRRTANHAAECEKIARILDKAQRHEDPAMPPRRPDARPMKQVAQTWRRPHIYSPEEIERLFAIARTYPSPRSPSRPINLYTMLVLAYCAGLRVGELARLTLADIDMRAGTIAIRETKFFKSRVLPLSDSAMAALRAFLEARRKAKAPHDPGAGLFWHDQNNRSYTRAGISYPLVDILRMADIKPSKGMTGPRVHDLRHTFVVHRILEWYRQGVNPQDRLPFLATYLGHRDISSTLVYITVTRELLHEANERFRMLGAPCLNAPDEVAS